MRNVARNRFPIKTLQIACPTCWELLLESVMNAYIALQSIWLEHMHTHQSVSYNWDFNPVKDAWYHSSKVDFLDFATSLPRLRIRMFCHTTPSSWLQLLYAAVGCGAVLWEICVCSSCTWTNYIYSIFQRNPIKDVIIIFQRHDLSPNLAVWAIFLRTNWLFWRIFLYYEK